MAGLGRTSVGRKMRRPIRMTVCVAIEAGHAPTRQLRTAIFGLIELLLRKRCHQKAQPLELLRIDDAVEQFVIILDGDEPALRKVAEVGTLIEIYCGRFRSRICSGIIVARLSQVVPATGLTRIPSWTGFVRSIVAPAAGRLLRS